MTKHAKSTHIEVHFRKNKADVTAYFAISERALQDIERWAAAKPKPPSGHDLYKLFDAHGKLDRSNGPAYIAREDDGTTCQAWYRDGQLHRTNGPAFVIHHPDGAIIEEWYRNDGKQKFKRTERVVTSSLAAIPGTKIRKPPAASL